MKYLLIFLASIILWSCSEPAVYEKTYSVDENAWNYNDTLLFEFDINNINEKYNLIVDLKYKNTYSYSNLFFFVDIKDPENIIKKDTIECFLALPNGKWLGKESGDYIEQQLLLKYNVNFPKKGHYSIMFKHAMRDTLLKKVSKVGLELHKYSEK